jgi:hypothetical protein
MTEIKMTLEQAEKFIFSEHGCHDCPYYKVNQTKPNTRT